MKAEVTFHTSSTPKKFENVYAVYTKGGLACIHNIDNMILKYPLCNIYSIIHPYYEDGKIPSKRGSLKEIELILHSTSAPKRMNVYSVYTKDALLCFHNEDDLQDIKDVLK